MSVLSADEINTITRYVACNRTENDEKSLFLRFQLLCLVLGTFSYVWVRRFRVVYASLFEQRKLSMIRRPSDMDHATNGESMNGGGTIEMATREEMSPLTNSNLEVV